MMDYRTTQQLHKTPLLKGRYRWLHLKKHICKKWLIETNIYRLRCMCEKSEILPFPNSSHSLLSLLQSRVQSISSYAETEMAGLLQQVDAGRVERIFFWSVVLLCEAWQESWKRKTRRWQSHNMKSLTVVPIEEQDGGPHLHGKWSIKYFIVNIWKQLVFIKQCWCVQRSTVFLLLFLKYYTFWLRAHEQAEVHRNKTKVWAEKLWF